MNVGNTEQPDLTIALEKPMTHLRLKPVLFPLPSRKTREKAEASAQNNLQHKVILEWGETQDGTSLGL